MGRTPLTHIFQFHKGTIKTVLPEESVTDDLISIP